jgi:NAD(P)-dependent dehydrogenase (short-subunit alcohol dehydrogenase family)
MGSYAVTGSMSGFGKATAERLRADGHDVLGVDLHDADVVADLGTAAGRADAIEQIGRAGPLDGLVTAAGIGGSSTAPGGRLVSVNYFGTVVLLEGLRPALARTGNAAVVCLGSNSATVQPDWDVTLAAACLAGDEDAAVAKADAAASLYAYPAAKAAIAWYVRTHAPAWVGDGIRLNAIAPGLTETALTQGQRADPIIGKALAEFPVPLGRAIAPEEIADVIVAMLAMPALVGSVVTVDGGTEALLRPRDWPSMWSLS